MESSPLCNKSRDSLSSISVSTYTVPMHSVEIEQAIAGDHHDFQPLVSASADSRLVVKITLSQRWPVIRRV
jgi:hypothetical protein